MRGLVLSGGGAKGTWELGALQALVDRGLTFDMVRGVSVGGLAAAMYAANALPLYKEIFFRLKNEDVYTGGPLRGLWGQLQDVWSGGLGETDSIYSTKPLEAILRRYLPWQALLSTPIDVAWSGFSLTTFKTSWFRPQECGNLDTLVKTLLITSAIPVAFPAQELDGEWWVDGGVSGVTPLSEFVHCGCTEIWAILLDPLYPKPEIRERYNSPLEVAFRSVAGLIHASTLKDVALIREKPGVTVYLVAPDGDLGSSTEFSPERSEALWKAGHEWVGKAYPTL